MAYFDPAHYFTLRTDLLHRDPWIASDTPWVGYTGDTFTCEDQTGGGSTTVTCVLPITPNPIIRDRAVSIARNVFEEPKIALSALDPPPDFISIRVIGLLGTLFGYAESCLITDGIPAGCDSKPPEILELSAHALKLDTPVGHYVPDASSGLTATSPNMAGNIWRDDGIPVYTDDPDNTASQLLFTPDEVDGLRVRVDQKIGEIGDTTDFQFRITPWWLTTPPPAGQFMCVL